MKHDVIIVGGGIIGATLGCFLAQDGLRVLIIEPGEIGGGTTSASFAWANGSSKTGDAAYHRLNAAGVAGYRTLMAEFGAGALGVNPTGAVRLARRSDRPGHQAMLRDAEALARLGYAAHLLDNSALRRLEPGLHLAPDCEALHLPDDLIVDAPHFARFMAARCQALGGRVEHTRATALIAGDNGVVGGVETGAGPRHAPVVITAVGKDTGAVLATLTGFAPFASRFALRQVPGLLLTTPPQPPATLRHLIHTSGADELHMLPTAGGGLKIGSDNVDAMIWEDRSDSAMHRAGRALLGRAEQLLPGLAQRTDIAGCRLQIGIRPYPHDGKSLIGELPGASGLYVIATHSGITLAPVIAALMARWLSTGTAPEQLAPYSLTRLPGFAS